MATKNLTVNIKHIDPRVGDKFGFEIRNNGNTITFPDGTGWNKTFVEDSTTTIPVNRLTKFSTAGDLESIYQSFNGEVHDSIIQSDGKIVVVGAFTLYGGTTANRVIRLNNDGSVDTTFGTGANGTVYTVAETVTSLYFGGSFTSFDGFSSNRIIKVSKITGSISITFRDNVNSSSTLPGFNSTIYSIIADSGNTSIYVGGIFSRLNNVTANALVKLSITGTLVKHFDLVATSLTPTVYKLVRQSDNKILVGGANFNFMNSSGGGFVQKGLFRLNSNDTLDTSFLPSTSLDIPVGFNAPIRAINVEGSFVYVGGEFTSFNGTEIGGIVKLTMSNGSISSTFSGGITSPTPFVKDIQVLSSGDILIGGSISVWQGASVGNFISISSSGALNYTTNFNSGVNSITKVPSVDSVLIGGNFSSFIESGVSDSFLTIPIGTTPEDTAINTYVNLLAWNSVDGATSYEIDGDIATLVYTSEEFDIVTFSYFDTPGYVEITYDNEPPTFEDIVRDSVTRSPIFIKTEASDISKVEYEIKAFEGGIFSTQPLLTTLTKTKLITSQNTLYCQISEYLKEKLEIVPSNFLDIDTNTIRNTYSGISKWCVVNEKRYLINDLISEKLNFLLVTDGYIEEDENQGLKNILVNGNKRDVLRGQKYQLFFKTNKLQSVTLYYGGVVFDVTLLPYDITNNQEYIKYLCVDTTVADNFKYVFQYEDTVEEIKFNVIDECKYLNQYLVFKNKFGVLDTLPVSKKTSRSLANTSTEYKRSILDINGNYDRLAHSNKIFNLNSEESIILNTPIMSEYMEGAVQDLHLSEQIWLFDGLKLTPVLKVDDNIDIKNKLNSKTIQYTIKVKKSHSKINRIK